MNTPSNTTSVRGGKVAHDVGTVRRGCMSAAAVTGGSAATPTRWRPIANGFPYNAFAAEISHARVTISLFNRLPVKEGSDDICVLRNRAPKIQLARRVSVLTFAFQPDTCDLIVTRNEIVLEERQRLRNRGCREQCRK